jgi:hypothetical protein
MGSCNISMFGYKNDIVNKNFSSVCTGSVSNSTLEGLRTLNHANLSSPYSTTIIANGGLVYAQLAVIKSLQIYKSAKIISGEINEDNYYRQPTEE